MCACGLDIGTCFLVSARQDNNNQIQYKSIRDAFIDMDNEPQTKQMLKLSQTNFIEAGEKIFIVGETALTMANIFKREARRPLSKGVLSQGEIQAEKILLVLLESIAGQATTQNEICFYSIPGNPVDGSLDIVYHSAMFSKLIGSLNYKPVSLNEAAAISYSNAAKENFSSLSISFGAGMVNVCLMYQTMIGMSFSIIGSGDFLDDSTARAVGSTASRIQIIKERGLNLLDPNEGDVKTFREREALIIYYKSMILRVLSVIKSEFLKNQSSGGIDLPTSIPIILSGGTSLAKGFKELFEAGFESMKLPFSISEIRMATDPLNAVAQGLLVAALNYGQ